MVAPVMLWLTFIYIAGHDLEYKLHNQYNVFFLLFFSDWLHLSYAETVLMGVASSGIPYGTMVYCVFDEDENYATRTVFHGIHT